MNGDHLAILLIAVMAVAIVIMQIMSSLSRKQRAAELALDGLREKIIMRSHGILPGVCVVVPIQDKDDE